uniref:Uncharacterized protein n=1 Tax=Picea glauca TaxID=3330 RepID=A0A101LVX0_PICGL|nr:hypothetical protein ABT39_MTgene1838 [Picea glauca]
MNFSRLISPPTCYRGSSLIAAGVGVGGLPGSASSVSVSVAIPFSFTFPFIGWILHFDLILS